MNQTDTEFLKKYQDFVESRLSPESKDVEALIDRIKYLADNYDFNLPMVKTGADGMGSEAGEVGDMIKKMLYQGKEPTEEFIIHLEKELGDVIFYWIALTVGLRMNPVSIIAKNIDKIEARYPSGKFEVKKSENRKEGDV